MLDTKNLVQDIEALKANECGHEAEYHIAKRAFDTFVKQSALNQSSVSDDAIGYIDPEVIATRYYKMLIRMIDITAVESTLHVALRESPPCVIGALETLLHANFINAQLTLDECQQAIRLAQQQLRVVAMQARVEGGVEPSNLVLVNSSMMAAA